MADFQKSYNGNKLSPNDVMSDIIKWLKVDRLRYPIAPLLAWMSFYHRGEAKQFYLTSGLARELGFSYRPYLGFPGDRAKIRAGLKPSAAPAEFWGSATSRGEASQSQMDASVVERTPWIVRLDAAMAGYRNDLTRAFVGHENRMGEIDRFIESRRDGTSEQYLVVGSLAGLGKSSLLAKWMSLEANTSGDRIVFYAFGAEPSHTRSPTECLRYLNHEVAVALGYVPAEGAAATQLMGALSRDRSLTDGLLIVIIDGLDEADGDLEFFLPKRLGRGVCLIVSARQEFLTNVESVAHFFGRAHHRGLEQKLLMVPCLDKAEADALIRSIEKTLLCRRELSSEELGYIYQTSDGHPIAVACLARYLIKDINAQSGSGDAALRRALISEFDSGDRALQALLGKVRSGLSVSDIWLKLFYAACAFTAPMSISIISRVIESGDIIAVRDIPPPVRRWLTISANDCEGERTVSFGCPVMKGAFASILRDDLRETHKRIGTVLREKYDLSSPYFVACYPFHLTMAGEIRLFEDAIGDIRLMNARYDIFGDEAASELFTIDSMRAISTAVIMGISPPDPKKIVEYLMRGE